MSTSKTRIGWIDVQGDINQSQHKKIFLDRYQTNCFTQQQLSITIIGLKEETIEGLVLYFEKSTNCFILSFSLFTCEKNEWHKVKSPKNFYT